MDHVAISWAEALWTWIEWILATNDAAGVMDGAAVVTDLAHARVKAVVSDRSEAVVGDVAVAVCSATAVCVSCCYT